MEYVRELIGVQNLHRFAIGDFDIVGSGIIFQAEYVERFVSVHTETEGDVEVEYVTEAEIKARLSGIAAARAQLVAQRDTVTDERRNRRF